jgi:predicted SAM-dependent methyltransferase
MSRKPYSVRMTRGGIIASSAVAGGPLDRLLSAVPGARPLTRTCVQAANAPFARARLRKELARTHPPIRLEIGGHKPREGWIVTNVNAVARLYLDATRRWPFNDDTVEYVFSDNVIEHLTLQAGRAMLKEARRCLQPGGTIRIVTPDLRVHVDMYLSGVTALNNEASSHYRDLGLVVEHPIDLVRIPIASFGHHQGYLYDFDTLAAELERAGFTAPTRFDLGISDHAALSGLDIRSHEGGAQLAVEATA